MTITVRLALLAACVGAVAACSSSPDKSSSSTSTVLVTSASFTTIVPTTTTTTTATTAPDTEPSSSNGPVLTPEDAHMVADCVKFIPIGAVIADAEATSLWDLVERDLTKLTGLCTEMLTTAPATLASLSLKLTAFEIAQEADTTTSTAVGAGSSTTAG